MDPRLKEIVTRRQQVLARAILVLTAAVLAVLVAFPAAPFGGPVLAQQTPTPSPTATPTATATPDETPSPTPTPTPTPTVAPPIQLLNPSRTSPAFISDLDMGDHGYHFVATVSPVPPQPSVEIRMVQGTVDRVIGTAERVTPDTWHLHWQIPADFPTGEHTVHAVLYSAGQEVGRDRMAASLDKSFAAIRIDYPVNGMPWGVYIPPGENQVWAGLIDFTRSRGVRFVNAFYTRTPPGQEPAWTGCGSLSGLSGGPAEGRIRCALAAGHDARDVTGVMLVPDETPSPAPVPAPSRLFEGASDAHRVAPYYQRATTVVVSTQDGQRTFNRFGCSSLFEVFVTDQLGRPIPRHNVDVHATGPNAEGGFQGTVFDTSTQSDPNQQPNQNHTSPPIAGWSCANNQNSGQNGNHARASEPDTRHIESLTSGTGQRTDDAGRFTFRLRSDVTGGTQITAWADRDNDDLYCADEAAGHNSIGWEVAPPDVSPHSPERGSGECPDPEPPHVTPSPTPTAAATQTPGDVVESGPCQGHPRNSRTPRDDADGMVIVGDDGDNILEGTDGDDIICGLGGHDKILGKAGNDKLYGDNGQDDVRGHAGQDTVVGGNGHDTLYGNKGHDTLRGNRHNDVLRGGHHNDTLVGGRGHDTLRGGRRHDTLRGGNGNDELFGNRGNDTLNGGPGFDRCRGGPGRDDLSDCET